jgi:predicted RNA binding protein YcfA (HicA-like mRNA interferase family)
MVRIPRDISGTEMAKKLERFGYRSVRQTGSHMRLTAQIAGKEHHITIPAHNPLKLGTLRSILRSIAQQTGLSVDDVAVRLF